jgi:hypothetical protein
VTAPHGTRLKCVPKAVKKYIQEVNKSRYEQKGKVKPPSNQAEERFLLPMSTKLYDRTLGDRVRYYDALLSLDQHTINIGRNTYGDDPSIDSLDSSDNIRIQNVDIRTGARPKDSVSDEEDQSSGEPYQDQVDDPGQILVKSDSPPIQVQKTLFKDTPLTKQGDGDAMKKTEVPKDQESFI